MSQQDPKPKPEPENDPSIDEQQLRIIEKGALTPVRLSPLSYADAISLRMKLYRLRQRLLRLDHPAKPAAKAIMIKLYPVARGSSTVFELMICPKVMGLEQALLNAGITTPEDEPPPLD